LQFGSQRLQLLGHRTVSMLPDPFPHPLHSGFPFLGSRASFYSWYAFPVRLPVKLKSQKVESPIIGSAVAAKSQRLGFIGGQFQPELLEPCFQSLIEGFGLVTALKAHHEVVGVPDQPARSSLLGPHFALKP
jgi:hypothetical protein